MEALDGRGSFALAPGSSTRWHSRDCGADRPGKAAQGWHKVVRLLWDEADRARLTELG